MNGTPAAVRNRFEHAIRGSLRVYISSIVAFDLWYGIAKSARTEVNARRLETFLSGAVIALPFDHEDSRAAGSIRAVLEAARANPDVLIPFASVDPHKGKLAVREAREMIEAGVRGFKFHPNTQAFWPNDNAFYPLYEVIAEAGLIALFHSGTTGIGAGMPGGGGIRLKYSNPMFVDDVAVDFPGMKIILAHPSFPWQDEALSVATHKPQVYIDLSGWSPKYFPPQLVQYANSLLQDKVLFGTDYPLLTPERWLSDFEKLPIKDSVRPKILKDNAARLLGLA